MHNMWLKLSQLRVAQRKKQPKQLSHSFKEKCIEMTNLSQGHQAKRWVLLFQDSFPPDPAYGFYYCQTMTTKTFQIPVKNVILCLLLSCMSQRTVEVLVDEREGGEGGSRDLIHAIPLYDMTRFVIETFSLLVSLFYLTNHLMLTRDSEHTSLYHF